jgi:hypothetical protein
MGGYMRLNLERVASHSTRLIGAHFGERFPFYYVMEYPKSGGTWLSQMIADYLQIPRPEFSVFPLGCECVIHGHWLYSSKLRRVFYLVRDGRDVAVSLYFRAIGELGDPRYPQTRSYIERRFKSLREADARNHPHEVLPRFIEEWVKHPAGTSVSWPDHVRQWAFDRRNVVVLRYEDLIRDAVGTLTRALPNHTRAPIDAERLGLTVRKFSFERQAGRPRGAEVRGAFLRKGVPGDWRNYFTREAAEVFDHYAGDTLVRLGYELDRDWHKDLSD